jgi:hypothetical protein
MTPEQIKELRADMAEGTPGRWISLANNEVWRDAFGTPGLGPFDRVARVESTYSYYAGKRSCTGTISANARRIARVPLLEAEVLRLTEANAALAEELAKMRELLADAVEDETEFETEWNKAARAALSHTGMTGQREGV